MSSRDLEVMITCDVMKQEGGRLLFRNKGGFINYAGHGFAGSFFFEFAVRPPGIEISPPKDLAVLSEADREAVLSDLDAWLAELGLSPYLPDNLEEEEGLMLCLWKGCGRQRLKGLYICRYHYDPKPRGVGRSLRYFETSRPEFVQLALDR
jgi:hypothetical protein